MNCSICYDAIASSRDCISCGNSDCTTVMCLACGNAYMDFSHRENQMPTCPSTSCNAHFLFTDLTRLDRASLEKYAAVCVRFLTTETKSFVEASVHRDAMIERLRREKEAFVRSRFAPAIHVVIDAAFAGHMKRISKANKAKLNALRNKGKCLNVLCPGILDADHKCTLCDVQFCSACEKEKTCGDHVCAVEDVLSVESVSGMVKCPQCKVPVVRSFGCDHITCAVCRTNFDYVTGKRCTAGNHTSDEKLVLNPHDSLVELYSHLTRFSDFKASLQTIDSMRPTHYNVNAVAVLIKNDASPVRIATEYARHVKFKHANKRYQRCLSKIEELVKKDALDVDALQGIVDYLDVVKK